MGNLTREKFRCKTNDLTFRCFICRVLWDRCTKIMNYMGPEQVWETSVTRWRLKVYERIIPWRKNGKMKERKAKVQVLGEEEVEESG